MTHDFSYLKDSSFLQQFDKIRLKQQFVKLIVLTFHEQPIEEIQGRVISGNFNLDGSSSMRRTGNINLITSNVENDLTKTSNLLSINKKVQVLIGFKNTTGRYENYDIIWFPQGIYAIVGANISNSVNGINIALTLHDKMAYLNGECGGILPASIILNEIESVNENGETEIIQPTLYQIIQQLINHFGGEQLGKIIISDLENKIKKIMKWTGSTPLYYYNNDNYHTFSTNYQEIAQHVSDTENIQIKTYGDDVGYILTNFVYPGELISKAGDSICTILDQIKNLLGNYEYFYDINGNFIFQQIKNFLNKKYSNQIITNINNSDYQVDYTSGQSVYTFDNSELIISISNSPQFQQIKNDFVVWGKRKSMNGQQIPIRYHLAIDEKPQTGNNYQHIKLITDEYGNQKYVYDETVDTSITSSDFRTDLLLSGVLAERFATDSNYYYAQLQNEWPKLYNVMTGQFKEDSKNHPNNIDFFLDFIDTQSSIGEYNIKNIGRRTLVITDDTINCIFAPEIPDIVIIKNGQDDTQIQRKYCDDRGQTYVQVDPGIYDMLWDGGSLKSAYDEIKKQLYQYVTFNEQVSLTTIPIYYLEPNTRITIRDIATGIYGDFIIKSISLPLDINGTMNISCTKALQRWIDVNQPKPIIDLDFKSYTNGTIIANNGTGVGPDYEGATSGDLTAYNGSIILSNNEYFTNSLFLNTKSAWTWSMRVGKMSLQGQEDAQYGYIMSAGLASGVRTFYIRVDFTNNSYHANFSVLNDKDIDLTPYVSICNLNPAHENIFTIVCNDDKIMLYINGVYINDTKIAPGIWRLKFGGAFPDSGFKSLPINLYHIYDSALTKDQIAMIK